MPTLQERQAPIDRSIVEALIEATPENWDAAEMLVERDENGSTENMSISISSPEGHKNLVGATDAIYEGLYRLSDCFRESGKIWRTVRYQVGRDSSGAWKYQVNFQY